MYSPVKHIWFKQNLIKFLYHVSTVTYYFYDNFSQKWLGIC